MPTQNPLAFEKFVKQNKGKFTFIGTRTFGVLQLADVINEAWLMADAIEQQTGMVVYPNDHRPAHVHVIGQNREAIFNLHCPSGLSQLSENYGFSRMELSRIAKELNHQVESLCASWRTTHGHC